ncbi:MAG: TlpA disulfide reductase family protein [Opitutaceae bacterium]|jgi:thiol-disulfide isomerase/thioredoxin
MWYPNKTLLACLLGLVAGGLVARAEVKVGAPFPELATFTLEGTLPAREGRVVLIDFWATWCSPCKASFPFYSALQTELAPRGFTLVAVSVDKKAGPYEDFVKRFKPAFTTVRDGEQKLVASAQPPAMPTCYLLDRRGVLRLVHSGFHGDADGQKLRAEIIKLLDEKP